MAASNAMSILPTKSQPIISQEELKQLLREFKSQRGESLHLTALGYFGSYARGEAGPDSDIDIVFKTDYPNRLLTSAPSPKHTPVLGWYFWNELG